MTGRNFFKKYKKLILFALKILFIVPFPLRLFLFDCLAGAPGKIGVGLRYLLLRTLCSSCGDNVYIGRWCSLKNINKLIIGNNVSVHDYCYFDAKGNIEIGDNVSIAHNSTILSFEHSFSDFTQPIKYQPLEYGKVLINDDVWIGCGCRVLSGTIIYNRTIVGANSVVKHQIGPGVYVGSIAKKVKDFR